MTNSTLPILIMTATVKPPPDALQLTRVDASLRMNDYCEALAYYLSLLTGGILSGIVFAENSNHDLSPLTQLVADKGMGAKVEFIGFNGLDYPSSYGRGHGEFKLLDYAMHHSEMIQKAASSTEIWKITGRYQVLNFAEILARRPIASDIWIHCRNHPKRWADMYLMGWRKDYYLNNMVGLYREFNDGVLHISAEVVFRKFIDRLAKGTNVSQRIIPVPDLVGIRGIDSSSYERQRWKFFVRALAARLLPKWWI